jgi:AmmeMemoRadiSam system protein A
MEPFRLSLSDEEQRTLKDLARLAIASQLTGRGPASPPEPESPTLKLVLGAFVTLKRGGQLRGCIGNIIGQGPLFRTVWNMAQAAAFQDPRFRPLDARELDGLELEVSVLGPIEPCPDPALVEVGRHGLI